MADGIPLKNGKSLRDALVGKMPGEKVNLQVLKNQEKITKTIEVTLGSI
jgi:S1-C subfamily serine protease